MITALKRVGWFFVFLIFLIGISLGLKHNKKVVSERRISSGRGDIVYEFLGENYSCKISSSQMFSSVLKIGFKRPKVVVNAESGVLLKGKAEKVLVGWDEKLVIMKFKGQMCNGTWDLVAKEIVLSGKEIRLLGYRISNSSMFSFGTKGRDFDLTEFCEYPILLIKLFKKKEHNGRGK